MGSPVSLQTNNRKLLQDWKAQVRKIAVSQLPAATIPAISFVEVEIAYYYTSAPLDIDNIAKPILDALNLLVYIDDKQISDLMIRKRHLYWSIETQTISPAIAEAIFKRKPFVYVKIDRANLEPN